MSTTSSHRVADVSSPLGGSFLIEEASAAEVFTPEDFSGEQRQVGSTADQFMTNEVMPAVTDQEEKKPGVARGLMEKAGELGLLAVLVPEQYGGLELDLTTQQIVAERIGRYASFSTTYGAHSGIGTLPLVFFGTDEQKRRYLPRLVSGELLAAYCLSEAHAGSDALAARTRAELLADKKHYLLNGEKMWISNGGWADLYTVFAKVDGEKFTAFLVERNTPGVSPGAEEHKMGIRGSSTTPLVLENARVPAENLLGEIGRGHIIAFNILNLGRLKLGASCVGGMKDLLADAIAYAKQRKAFGRPISEFGLIGHKLAEMAIRLYASESMVYRTSGMIDARLADFTWQAEGASQTALRAIEEFAVECSIVKVYATEALDYVVDEGVQIHGGYGFHQDYAVERAYRDSRINRIFEGTNEINRLLITGMLLKRARQGRLALTPAVEAVMREVAGGDTGAAAGGAEGLLGSERRIVSQSKKLLLFAAGIAFQRFGEKLDAEQEVTAALSDMVMAIYAAESALLRAEKLLSAGRGEQAAEMTTVLARRAASEIEHCAETAIAASLEGMSLEKSMAAARRLLRFAPANAIALRRRIAGRLLAAGKFLV